MIEHLFNTTIDIYERTIEKDDYGTENIVYNPKYINEPCRVNVLRENQQIINNKLTKPIDLRIYTNVLDIKLGDTIVKNDIRYNIIDFQDTDLMGKFMVIYASRSERK